MGRKRESGVDGKSWNIRKEAWFIEIGIVERERFKAKKLFLKMENLFGI